MLLGYCIGLVCAGVCGLRSVVFLVSTYMAWSFLFQSPLPLSGTNRYYGQKEDWRRCFEEFLYWFPFVLFVLGSGIAI